MNEPKRNNFKNSEDYLSAKIEYLEFKIVEIEKDTREMLSNHVYINLDEFKELATFVVCNGHPNQQADLDVVHDVLDRISINCISRQDWVLTYAELTNKNTSVKWL